MLVLSIFSGQGQLYNEWQSKDPVSDDYGQTIARIIVTPLLSGLAAIVGVFLIVMLSITLITPQNSASSTTTPPSTPTTVTAINSTPTTSGITAGTSTPSNFPRLETIFDRDTYPQNLLYAAIIGYLPSLVFRLLQQRTEQVLSQIQTSSAGDHKSSDESAKKGNGTTSQGNGKSSMSVLTSSNGNVSPTSGGSTEK